MKKYSPILVSLIFLLFTTSCTYTNYNSASSSKHTEYDEYVPGPSTFNFVTTNDLENIFPLSRGDSFGDLHIDNFGSTGNYDSNSNYEAYSKNLRFIGETTLTGILSFSTLSSLSAHNYVSFYPDDMSCAKLPVFEEMLPENNILELTLSGQNKDDILALIDDETLKNIPLNKDYSMSCSITIDSYYIGYLYNNSLPPYWNVKIISIGNL